MAIATYDDREVRRSKCLASQNIEGEPYILLKRSAEPPILYERGTRRFFQETGDGTVKEVGCKKLREVQYKNWGRDGKGNQWLSIGDQFYRLSGRQLEALLPVL